MIALVKCMAPKHSQGDNESFFFFLNPGKESVTFPITIKHLVKQKHRQHKKNQTIGLHENLKVLSTE